MGLGPRGEEGAPRIELIVVGVEELPFHRVPDLGYELDHVGEILVLEVGRDLDREIREGAAIVGGLEAPGPDLLVIVVLEKLHEIVRGGLGIQVPRVGPNLSYLQGAIGLRLGHDVHGLLPARAQVVVDGKIARIGSRIIYVQPAEQFGNAGIGLALGGEGRRRGEREDGENDQSLASHRGLLGSSLFA